jgi:hypothetical protein
MWTVTTSDGLRVADICSETDARRLVHRLGTTQLRGPYSWDVVDSMGISSSPRSAINLEVVTDDCRTQSTRSRDRRYCAVAVRQPARSRHDRRRRRGQVQTVLA